MPEHKVAPHREKFIRQLCPARGRSYRREAEATARSCQDLEWGLSPKPKTDDRQPADRERLKMIFVLDNYDSFTYNLVQYIGELGHEVVVRRNDKATLEEIEGLGPERIVISPGPCTPQQAGISMDLIKYFAGRVPILGVCLGHQAIGAAFGGKVVRALNLMHGKTSSVEHDGRTIFRGIPSPLTATRYHSLIVEERSLPADLEISATCYDRDGTRVIMGLRHCKFAVEGVQFHPESVLTTHGIQMVRNFLQTCAASVT